MRKVRKVHKVPLRYLALSSFRSFRAFRKLVEQLWIKRPAVDWSAGGLGRDLRGPPGLFEGVEQLLDRLGVKLLSEGISPDFFP